MHFNFLESYLSKRDDTEPNEKGLQFYDHVFAELVKNGIEQIVSLTYFDAPLRLKKHGFWEG